MFIFSGKVIKIENKIGTLHISLRYNAPSTTAKINAEVPYTMPLEGFLGARDANDSIQKLYKRKISVVIE